MDRNILENKIDDKLISMLTEYYEMKGIPYSHDVQIPADECLNWSRIVAEIADLLERIETKTIKKCGGVFMFEKAKCEKEITKTFKKFEFHPLLVEGSGFPEDFLMFRSCISLMNNSLFLHPMGKEPESSYESLRKVFQKIEYSWCTYIKTIKELPEEDLQAKMRQKRQEQLREYKEDLTDEYRKVLELEFKNGTVRFPVQITPYCSDTKVKSQYGDWEINYSPKVISLLELPTDDILRNQAALFSESWILKRPCRLVSVYFGEEIPVSEYQTLYQMFSEIFRIMNAYQIQEFEEKKDDRKYQHRSDWNPADF